MDHEIPLVSVRYARHFLAFFEGRGVGRRALLNGVGVDEATLADPERLLSMQQVEILVDRAQRLVPDERTPFQFGQHLDLSRHGLLGFAYLNRDDPWELIRLVIDYIRVGIPILDLECSINGRMVSIRLKDRWQTGAVRPFLVKVYMGSIHSMMSLICTDFSFLFDFASHLDRRQWQHLIQDAEIGFNAACNEVSMTLSERLHRDHQGDVAHYLTWLHAHETPAPGSTDQVVRQVRSQIIHNPGRQATLERVAQQLGMSARSLRRHLQLAGTSFNEIRNEIRGEFATRYLTDTRVPLERIAHQLGYSDQASFTRAYRAWTGRTPGQVRKEAGLHD